MNRGDRCLIIVRLSITCMKVESMASVNLQRLVLCDDTTSRDEKVRRGVSGQVSKRIRPGKYLEISTGAGQAEANRTRGFLEMKT